MPVLKLQSSDGKIFTVDVEVAIMFTTIKNMLEALNTAGEFENVDEILPIQNMDGRILEKIIEWATHHKDDPEPEKLDTDSNAIRPSDDLSDWDKEFLKVDRDTLFGIMLGANYLDIRGLLDCTTKTVANMIKGKSPQEIREAFGSNTGVS